MSTEIVVSDDTPRRPWAKHSYTLHAIGSVFTAEAIAKPLDDRLGFGPFELVGVIQGRTSGGYTSLSVAVSEIDELIAVLQAFRAQVAADTQESPS